MRIVRQFRLLLWKNYLIQKRKILVTVIEVGLPAFFALLLILIRQKVQATEIRQPTEWSPFEVSHMYSKLCPSIMCSYDLYFAPNNTVESNIMHTVKTQLAHGIPFLKGLQSFSTEEELVSHFMKHSNTTLAGVIFSHLPEYSMSGNAHSKHIEYKIRFPYTPRESRNPFNFATMGADANWRTKNMFPLFQKVGPRSKNSTYGSDPGYLQNGFLTLQHQIDQAILSEILPSSQRPTINTKLRRFPYPPYNDDPFVLVLQNQFPFVIMISFVFSALQIVKEVVHEKERKLKESMKMMGLDSWLHWTAWFTKYLLFLLISVILMTIFFCLNVGQYGSVVGYTHWSILLVFLLLYAISTISFSFMISVFFNKANSGAAAGGILFFVSYIPYTFLQQRYNALSMGGKVSSCLISNVAMSMGAQVIGMFEGTGAGIQWSTINQGASVDDDFTMLWVFVMLILDSVLYAMVAWYVEAVWPGEYGIPLPWYFPFMRSYWCGPSKITDDEERTPLLSNLSTQRNEFIESEPQSLKPGIRIMNLTKIFQNGKKENIAVNSMTLNMYEGQITALLGHNGAGKTTTMSMLTGFFPATSGSALVNGYDIRSDISSVRQSLGLCPQHNVLFDTLTVEEHLEFFAKLKGCPGKDVPSEITSLLESFGLEPKRHTRTKYLSGGMKRKLSVCIALIGGSKVVILDEPTSGMDPDARRQTWDILQRHRVGRTMVLTTHFMDEADILGDRIAIMTEGVVQCCGTPLFLKNKYGAGYHMVMVKEPGCDVEEVTLMINKHVPTARLENNISAELSHVLPHESKSQFVSLFNEIENRKEELKIASYGISVTTMEEVFLKVGENSAINERLKNTTSTSYSSFERANSVLLIHTRKNAGARLRLQQFHGMFMKRVLHTVRNWLVTATQLFVPLFFTILALIVIKTLPHPEDSPPLTLNMSHFDTNYILYGSDHKPTSLTQGIMMEYKEQFTDMQSIPKQVNLLNETMEDHLISIGKRGVGTYDSQYLIATELNQTQSNNLNVTAFFNAQAYHTAPMTLNAFDNSLLNYFSNESYTLSTVNHPFPRTVENKVNGQLTQQFEGFAIASNVVFGMAFLASSFVVFLIKERTVKAKHCQFVSGVHSYTFWSATFLWDLINYLIPCLFLIVTFVGFEVKAYVDDGRFLYVFLLFLLYGWAVLPFMYILSFIFTIPASGFVWLSMLNLLTGIATILAVNILRIPGLNTLNVSKILEWIFLTILPNFCLGQGLSDFYSNYEFLQICSNAEVQFFCLIMKNMTNPCCKGKCGDECVDYTEDYLSWQPGGIGRMLVFLGAQGVVFFLLLFIMESQAFQRMWYKFRPKGAARRRNQSDALVKEDSDVEEERRRITAAFPSDLAGSETLLLCELSKSYGNLLAVDRLSLGIPQGECFGLLGINGAGKTSTFKMLTGDETVSSGEAFLNGFNITKDIDKVRQQLGYCPQFDALIDQLTGRETLTMYARLRGIPEVTIPHSVQALIERLLFEQYADSLVKTYSGGNKRKLSTAIALIGDPPIVFLDEPSTGMDPVARRLLWDTLSEIRASGSTLVLTSHSMEECEALCTKVAIMVNGKTKCLGSTQKLKSKFGKGYTLLAKVAPLEPQLQADTRPIIDYIQRKFPGSILKDLHQGMVHFHITDTSLKWAELFSALEEAKDTCRVEDYSISQTTLEQVFLNFARSQIPPQEASAGWCRGCCLTCRGCLCSCMYGCQSCRQNNHELVVVATDDEDDSTNLI